MDDVQAPVKAEAGASGSASPASIEPRVTEFLRLGVLALFAYLSLTLVAPFAIIAVWAGILAVALYPLFKALTALFGGRPRLAAAAITLLALMVIAGPLAAIALSFAEAVQALLGKLAAGTLAVPAPPDAVRDWPLIGEWLHTAWTQASGNLEATLQRLAPSLLQAGGTVIGKIARIGVDLIGFIVSVIIAGFLFRPGPRLGEGLKIFARRVAGDRGAGFVDLAGATIRNVARGVIGVALLQALLAGLAFSLFDIPGASVLAFAVLIFCIIQIGPAPVLLPVVIWAWMSMETRAALGLTLILALIGLIDNVLKPMLVARGLKTPMLVILAGVIGGTLSYGLIGLFLGPIVLGVFYDLVVAWMGSARRDASTPDATNLSTSDQSEVA
ncbi:AI-2E family transporter [Sinorhizobium terangae]|uniref:AI-2E family transporter n=1 Tax=Sinorhizobium terangae TaxID=110322 RepID=UPI0017B186FB|nr:AI-2E family transporter [Sinorhizobium terangae]MBB4185676.1 putative PurR-regulated permease PerM [Sinorhizobium terangae]WFU46267.1 AI-2E family transporter [Sinorhizobium terangae]